MRRSKRARAFALYEVLIGLTIFVVGTLAIGRSVENCLHASSLSEQEDRVRRVLANRMAEIQATPGTPDEKKESNIETGSGVVKLVQKCTPASLKNEKDLEIAGITRVTLTAEWKRNGVPQARKVEFYV
ncbi:MAG TPA: type II secretion system protein, partial [Chthoniobacterales bacterium]